MVVIKLLLLLHRFKALALGRSLFELLLMEAGLLK
jgi:hypothetical protein